MNRAITFATLLFLSSCSHSKTYLDSFHDGQFVVCGNKKAAQEDFDLFAKTQCSGIPILLQGETRDSGQIDGAATGNAYFTRVRAKKSREMCERYRCENGDVVPANKT